MFNHGFVAVGFWLKSVQTCSVLSESIVSHVERPGARCCRRSCRHVHRKESSIVVQTGNSGQRRAAAAGVDQGPERMQLVLVAGVHQRRRAGEVRRLTAVDARRRSGWRSGRRMVPDSRYGRSSRRVKSSVVKFRRHRRRCLRLGLIGTLVTVVGHGIYGARTSVYTTSSK